VTDHELVELIGRTGNLYTQMQLSPPSAPTDALANWMGLTADENPRRLHPVSNCPALMTRRAQCRSRTRLQRKP